MVIFQEVCGYIFKTNIRLFYSKQMCYSEIQNQPNDINVFLKEASLIIYHNGFRFANLFNNFWPHPCDLLFCFIPFARCDTWFSIPSLSIHCCSGTLWGLLFCMMPSRPPRDLLFCLMPCTPWDLLFCLLPCPSGELLVCLMPCPPWDLLFCLMLCTLWDLLFCLMPCSPWDLQVCLTLCRLWDLLLCAYVRHTVRPASLSCALHAVRPAILPDALPTVILASLSYALHTVRPAILSDCLPTVRPAIMSDALHTVRPAILSDAPHIVRPASLSGCSAHCETCYFVLISSTLWDMLVFLILIRDWWLKHPDAYGEREGGSFVFRI